MWGKSPNALSNEIDLSGPRFAFLLAETTLNLGTLNMTFRLLIALLFLFSQYSYSAEENIGLAKPSVSTQNGPDLTKVRRIPRTQDDQATQEVLRGLLAQAGWFPNINVTVSKGLVTIEGRVQDKAHLQWLVDTADRLPTVIAVINKATLEETPVSDFSPAIKEVRRLLEVFKKRLPLIVSGLILAVVFWFGSAFLLRGLKSFWGRHITNAFLVGLVSRTFLIPLYAFMLYVVLAAFGLSGVATTIIGGTGVLSIVLGFAFKGIAENFLSGILLAIRSPFTKGDQITVGAYTGIVQNLNMRGTTIMDFDGNLILIPNYMVVQSVVLNATATPRTRITFVVGIGLQESIEHAQEIIKKALQNVPDVLLDPKPLAAVDSLGPSAINLKVYFWIDSLKSSGITAKSRAINASIAALVAAKIDLPDEARETIFRDVVKVAMVGAEEIKVKEKPFVSSKVPAQQDENPEQTAKELASTSQLPGNENSTDLLN